MGCIPAQAQDLASSSKLSETGIKMKLARDRQMIFEQYLQT